MRKNTMKNLFPVLAVFLLLAHSLSGCVPSMTGVSGTSLISTAFPRLTMTANPPLTLQGYDRLWVSLQTDVMGMDPTCSMDYAVYGEGEEGPITRHAHVMVVRPNNDEMWYFQPESFGTPGAISFGRKVISNYSWTSQVLRVNGVADWFSVMWAKSGRETPEQWIAQRFSGNPDSKTRIVAEYREPWPECLDPGVENLLLVRKSCLESFFERAEAAFTLDMHALETIEPPFVPSKLIKPDFMPDMRRLAGELRYDEYPLFLRW